ncbi:MAG: curli assembly protein CsgF [Bacteroidota bacterium]|nr:curli assembly protein CsgF [Bacteroidota bacterium]MDP4206597.1 curli assembly protein CsgF [Bacteroidota bacterium]
MKRSFILLGVFLCCLFASYGQQMVYKPVNPAFGGDSYNYTWLLNSAQAQNKYTAPKTAATATTTKSTLEKLKENINNQILSQLSNYILQNAFGSTSQLTNGTYKIGNYSVSIGNSSEGITIDISDITNGDHSQVVVPYL